MSTYTEGFNDGVMAAKYGPYASTSDPVLDRLREMFGIEASDIEAVFAAVEAYDRHNLRTIYAQHAELASLRAIPYDETLVLLRELEDRERLAFGQPLPETSDVVRRFAACLPLPAAPEEPK